MKIEKTKLAPVPRDQFKTGFMYAANTLQDASVLDTYVPVISALEHSAINRYFWFIVDFAKWINCRCGGDLEILTLLRKEEFLGKDHSSLYRVTHPDDLPKVLAFSRAYIQILESFPESRVSELNMSLYFRVLNNHSEYSWIMVQYPKATMDLHGKIQYGLVFVTDISHIKQDGIAMMVIVDKGNQSFQQYYCNTENELNNKLLDIPAISKREKEVLLLLAKGFASKQIASLLGIAIKTVENHRQNMLKKMHAKSSSELVSICIHLAII
jgi:DNA-binding CsgD family transcriptional regulator